MITGCGSPSHASWAMCRAILHSSLLELPAWARTRLKLRSWQAHQAGGVVGRMRATTQGSVEKKASKPPSARNHRRQSRASAGITSSPGGHPITTTRRSRSHVPVSRATAPHFQKLLLLAVPFPFLVEEAALGSPKSTLHQWHCAAVSSSSPQRRPSAPSAELMHLG